MKINPEYYSGDETTFQIISDKWYRDPFWNWFFWGTVLVSLYSLVRGFEVTPEAIDDADWSKFVNKKTRFCCKRQVSWFQITRGLSNFFSAYKDILYAFYAPHANVWVATMLTGSIFVPFVLNCLFLNHLRISDEEQKKKPWRYFWMYFGYYGFEITQA